MTGGEDDYRHTQEIDYLANFPGSRRSEDLVAVRITESDGLFEIDGEVNVTAEDLGIEQPLDVSAEIVPVQLTNTGQLGEDHPQYTTTVDLFSYDSNTFSETFPVVSGSSILVAVNSQSGVPFSVSLNWREPKSGDTILADSATDLGLSSVTTGDAEVTRKGMEVELSITNEDGNASENTINIFLDSY
jgi:hypothetical protein